MTYAQPSAPCTIAQNTDRHVVKLMTMASAEPNDNPLFTVFFYNFNRFMLHVLSPAPKLSKFPVPAV